MDWARINQSHTAKLAAIVFVAVLTLVGGNIYNAYRTEALAQEPLPGASAGNRCDLWFIGSSTIHRWDALAADMAPWQTVKRGVDGANFPQLAERFALDPAKVPPRGIVLYAGENDIAGGTDPNLVFDELQRFLALKTRMFGQLPVVFVSVKPSPTRWANRPLQLRYNAAVQNLASRRADLSYTEIGPLLMAGDKPGDHYAGDGIHLTPEGYRLWTPVLKAALEQRLGPAQCSGPPPVRQEPVRPFPG